MGSEKPKAILFDMDDTILAYDAVTEPAWRAVCRRFAPRISGATADELFASIFAVSEWYWSDKERHRQGRLNLTKSRREVVSIAFTRIGMPYLETASELADAYGIEREALVYAIPGAIDVLRHFKRKSRLALVTNGASLSQRRKIERFELSPLFDHILIEEEFGTGKPDERVFRHTLEKLGVAADEAWMVGDDLERDIGGATSSGIFSVWVDWRGEGLPKASKIRPDKIVKSISELL